MNEPFHSKPEPLPAKSKWHYDSYYLSQLERLNIRQSADTAPKTEEITEKTSEVKVPEDQTVSNIGQESEQQINKRSEVIKRIYELAASIGISVTIIENSQPAT